MKSISQPRNKVLWTQQQQDMLQQQVRKYGTTNWSVMADNIHLHYGNTCKTGKQCRQRWYNHLDPTITKKGWTIQQENLLFEKFRDLGSKWIKISEFLPGRTDNSIKNHFYSTIRKSLRRINKFLGQKNGTNKIRKIKPTVLSKFFTGVCVGASQNLVKTCVRNNRKKDQVQENIKQREIAYHLIDFSRRKLCDEKKKFQKGELQKLESLLEEISRLNNEGGEFDSKEHFNIKDMEDQINIEQSQKVSEENELNKQPKQLQMKPLLIIIEPKTQQKVEQSLPQMIELFHPNQTQRSQSTFSHYPKTISIGTLTQSQISNFKANKQNLEEDHDNQFNFFVDLEEEQEQLMGPHSEMRLTPTFITPNSACIKNKCIRQWFNEQLVGIGGNLQKNETHHIQQYEQAHEQQNNLIKKNSYEEAVIENEPWNEY